MAKVTKETLVAAKQAVLDVDKEIQTLHEGYTHGATATEAVEFDLAVSRLQHKRARLDSQYQDMMTRVSAALAKVDEEDESAEA